jgi:uncharacterized membrane protein YebE (DUF533 family)
VDRILSQVLGSGAASGFAGGVAGGLASGMLTSKGGRKLGKKALKVGGIAAVGGLAFAAWNRYRQNQAEGLGQHAASGTSRGPEADSASDGLRNRFVPPPDDGPGQETVGMTLLRAMIAAAQADGKLDGDERRVIFDRVQSLDLSPQEKSELFAQLERPVDLNALAATATTPELAAEIYTASLLAIDVDTAAERGYLAMLAARLELPEELVAAIHEEIEADVGHEDAISPGR